MIIKLYSRFEIDTELLVIPIFSDKNLEKSLLSVENLTGTSAALLKKNFKAEHCEIHPLYKNGSRIFLLGMGECATFSKVLKAFRSFSFKYKEKLSDQIAISFLHANQPADAESVIEAAVNGLKLGAYQIGRFKLEPENAHPFLNPKAICNIFIDPSYEKKAQKAAEKGMEVADTQLKVYDLVNAPGNKKLPQDLADWAQQSGKNFDYRVDIWNKTKIKKQGLDALLAVNRGSENPPHFIIMEYRAKRSKGDLPKIGLVGKGITFDTGGLSLKPSTNMHFMKSDMGGAAAVFGAVELVAKFQLPIHLIGIVPVTENSVDALSVKPGDVIDSHSGKTIEIIDTDAEGRLILADGLSYMSTHFKPDVLIDLATLTGSAVRTLGYHAAALFSNDDTLAAQLSLSGEKTGERLWRLPIWDVYKEDIKSDVADVRNYSGKPLAGSIGAAKFLEVFTHEHRRWAHLDIAGVAFTDSEFANQKSATAFGVRLLFDYLCEISDRKE